VKKKKKKKKKGEMRWMFVWVSVLDDSTGVMTVR
jgi:hypothetical protein